LARSVAARARYRTYGAAHRAAGIIYLSISAAPELYGVLPSTSGIVGTGAVSASADRLRDQRRGASASPPRSARSSSDPLKRNQANADLLLLYLFCMAAGLGVLAARRMALAAPVVAASYFGVERSGRRITPTRGECSCMASWAGAPVCMSGCASAGGRLDC
jgi:hypothetical protein